MTNPHTPNPNGLTVAVVGATGLVGQTMLQLLAQRGFPLRALIPVASAKSVGQTVPFAGQAWPVVDLPTALAQRPDVALFSAGGGVSTAWAPRFAEAGSLVVDNSSAWRMDPDVPLVVPEVNAHAIGNARLLANPNCSTIQLMVALAPLHRQFGLGRVVVSTYQAVTGTGKAAVDQLMAERANQPATMVYPHAIDLNCLPHCDVFEGDDGYTREELKVMRESRKILALPELPLNCTAVRVPVTGGHSEAVNLQLQTPATVAQVRQTLANAPGLWLYDDPATNRYPMPTLAQGTDWTWVGRLRPDPSAPNAFSLWVVADNLRKGAATNAVQVAEAALGLPSPAFVPPGVD